MNKDGFRRTRRVRCYPAHTRKDTLEIGKAIYRDNAGLPLDRELLATHLGISPRSSSFTTVLAASEQYGFTRGRYRDDTISLTDLGISISMPKSKQELTESLLKAAHLPEKFGKLNQLINEGELPKPEFLIPPNGVLKSLSSQQLIQTKPDSTTSASFWARFILSVKIIDAKP